MEHILILTSAGTDMRGRMIYTHSSSQFDWCIASGFTAKMTLKPAGLYLGATLVSASDQKLIVNENHWLMRWMSSTNKNQQNMIKHTTW